MIRSMTGYASAIGTNALGRMYCEIRTLNNRFLDINFRIPPPLTFLEPPLRDMIKEKVHRGKVDFYIRWEVKDEYASTAEINEALLGSILKNAHRVKKKYNIEGEIMLSDMVNVSGVITIKQTVPDREQVTGLATRITGKVLEKLVRARRKEGRELVVDLKKRSVAITSFLTQIKSHRSSILRQYRRNLRERTEALLKNTGVEIDNQKLEMEVALFAERSDITEEVVRLDSHIKMFKQELSPKITEPVGKKVEFLAQEMLRETNTIGSKARSSKIVTPVVKMKEEIEKIREQIHNIE